MSLSIPHWIHVSFSFILVKNDYKLTEKNYHNNDHRNSHLL